MRGLPIGATAYGRIVLVWFSSPTSDWHDNLQFAIVCDNDEQASNLVDAYGEMIYNSFVVSELVVKNESLEAELGRQAGIIADLMVKNNSLNETLARHYGTTV